MLSCVIIVPARGGSKRVPRKNLAPLDGKPLLLYTLEQIAEAGLRANAVVSTEDADIADLTKKTGFRVIDRPAALADDHASTESVLLHVLDTLKKEGQDFEWVMTLPPASPFRTAGTIKKFLDEAGRSPAEVDALFSLSERAEYLWRRREDGSFEPLFSDAARSMQARRAQGHVLYEENSAVYLTRVAALRTQAAAGATAPILGKNPRGVEIDHGEGIDINTALDVEHAEAVLRARKRMV